MKVTKAQIEQKLTDDLEFVSKLWTPATGLKVSKQRAMEGVVTLRCLAASALDNSKTYDVLNSPERAEAEYRRYICLAEAADIVAQRAAS